MHGHASVVQSLLAFGADADARTADVRTPVLLLSLMLVPATWSVFSVASVCIFYHTTHRASSLIRCIICHASHLTALLFCVLTRESNQFHLKCMQGDSPLMCAASDGHAEVVKLLLAHGADTSAKNKVTGTLIASPWAQLPT